MPHALQAPPYLAYPSAIPALPWRRSEMASMTDPEAPLGCFPVRVFQCRDKEYAAKNANKHSAELRVRSVVVGLLERRQDLMACTGADSSLSESLIFA